MRVGVVSKHPSCNVITLSQTGVITKNQIIYNILIRLIRKEEISDVTGTQSRNCQFYRISFEKFWPWLLGRVVTYNLIAFSDQNYFLRKTCSG